MNIDHAFDIALCPPRGAAHRRRRAALRGASRYAPVLHHQRPPASGRARNRRERRPRVLGVHRPSRVRGHPRDPGRLIRGQPELLTQVSVLLAKRLALVLESADQLLLRVLRDGGSVHDVPRARRVVQRAHRLLHVKRRRRAARDAAFLAGSASAAQRHTAHGTSDLAVVLLRLLYGGHDESTGHWDGAVRQLELNRWRRSDTTH